MQVSPAAPVQTGKKKRLTSESRLSRGNRLFKAGEGEIEVIDFFPLVEPVGS